MYGSVTGGDNTVSPMEFSASVHNANVGISSIASHFNGETIAIAAGKDTLYSGLIEAYISLKDNEIPTQNNYVILSFYEENLEWTTSDRNSIHGSYQSSIWNHLNSVYRLSANDQYLIDHWSMWNWSQKKEYLDEHFIKVK